MGDVTLCVGGEGVDFGARDILVVADAGKVRCLLAEMPWKE
jgi:hypothetical protein